MPGSLVHLFDNGFVPIHESLNHLHVLGVGTVEDVDDVAYEEWNHAKVGNTSFQNFEVKLYFNVGRDDKFGFEPETDWVKVIEVLGEF